MRDREIARLAARQYNRVSRVQLNELGVSDDAIKHRVAQGRLVITEEAVFAIAPVLDDPWGRWMGATLTQEGTVLAMWSAAVAYGALDREERWTTVMRPGRAGPRVHGTIKAWRRPDLDGETGELRGVPITSPERTLLDLAPSLPVGRLARALREMVRLRHATLGSVAEYVANHPRRWGARKLMRAVARYAGLPIERARSASEIKAMQHLRHGGRKLCELNVPVAGFEADLVWRDEKVIIEIDGGPFHEDRGEDARKEAAWRGEGYEVRRLDSALIWIGPVPLLDLAPDVT